MTSSKNAVSLLTAAALVVAPVGGVAATYQTGFADDGDGNNVRTEGGNPLPKSYEELVNRINGGERFTLADLELMKANGVFTDEAQYAELKAIIEGMPAAQDDAEPEAQPEPETQPEVEAPAEETPVEDAETPDADAVPPTEGADEGPADETTPPDPDTDANPPAEGDSTEDADDDTTVPPATTDPEAPGAPGEGEGQNPVEPPAAEKVTTMPEWPSLAMDGAALKAFLVEQGVPEDAITVVEVEDSTGTKAPGAILSTDPLPGTDIVAGQGVTITVAKAASEEPAPPVDPDPVDPVDPAPEPENPAPDNPVDEGIQKPDPDGAGGVTDSSHTAAVNKGQAQTPLKQVAVTVPSISFTHMDNSSYVARHYSEDLTTEKFISLVGEPARNIAAESDLYASVMIAQAILESASGNSTLAQAPNNNLFGIKGTYKGNSVQLPTREDDGSGATYTIMADFRQYETVEDSLSDYADLLSNSMGDFYAGARKSNTDSFVDACDFLVGRYATDIFYSEKLQDLIETYDLTRFDVPLTYELTETFVMPVKDEVTGLDLYLDPVADKTEYDALVAEYRAYVASTQEYQQALARWEEQMARAEDLYHVPVYLEKPATPAADTAMQQHKNAIDAERFADFDKLIAAGAPLPVREGRTLNDLTALANSFLGVPYLWGGTTPAGFDCSGLVQYCYREVFNIELPRTTYYQCEVGVEVPFEELLPGDLLFFDDGGDVHHVAMYLGDGYYVEAPHTGDVVKITAMNDKLPDFAKRIVESRDIDLSEYSDEQLSMFVEREKYLQEREQRLGVSDEALEELTEWLQGLQF
ncbi:glucosaminidase domain-containing protein [Adlercreutzia sp. R7]|uniref:Glucosaminidase domain-containing protein n=1 Tax=Adlercreutzia wanghongyangiae TaxID=3111451 RepID=A0ABU6IH21_9ACTN|nr:glucosaminidase domain-containing protein [Adlercreutzia sp. R7]